VSAFPMLGKISVKSFKGWKLREALWSAAVLVRRFKSGDTALPLSPQSKRDWYPVNLKVSNVVPLTCIQEAVIVRRTKRTFPEYR